MKGGGREKEKKEKGRGRKKKEGYLELIGVGDVVVGSTQVGRGGDEVHVEIGVIVLLEADGVHLVAGVGRGRWELCDNPVAQRFIILRSFLLRV